MKWLNRKTDYYRYYRRKFKWGITKSLWEAFWTYRMGILLIEGNKITLKPL